MGAADLQAHLLQDPGHTVANGRGRRQAQVHNTKRHAQPFRSFYAHQLTHTGDSEGGFLHRLSHHVKGLALDTLKRMVHHTGAGNAHIDDALRLADSVEGTGHKGIVLYGVGKNHQLGAAQAVLVLGQFGSLFHDTAHLGHGIHVDARLGGAHVDAGADHIGGGHCLRNGADQLPVAFRAALLDKGGEAADKVDAAGFGSPIQGFGNLHIAFRLAGSGHQRNRRNRNALVDNGNAELGLNVLADFYQVFGAACDLIVDFFAALIHIRVRTVQEADAHGNGPDVQVLIVDHVQSRQNILLIQHCLLLKSGAWTGKYPPAGPG